MVFDYTVKVWASKRLLLSNMIVCVCNNISESQIRVQPSLLDQCATVCATCCDTVAALRLELECGVGGSNGEVVLSPAPFEIGAQVF